ncbi:hypothetical protein AB6A40_004340 [Gnathostoma spinigerum]|uniref:Uncharacterized protein n=1 Tax=Gnathostoma spinigerum TaxID=75299 RepID=A0ABD6ED97_9BILA
MAVHSKISYPPIVCQVSPFAAEGTSHRVIRFAAVVHTTFSDLSESNSVPWRHFDALILRILSPVANFCCHIDTVSWEFFGTVILCSFYLCNDHTTNP